MLIRAVRAEFRNSEGGEETIYIVTPGQLDEKYATPIVVGEYTYLHDLIRMLEAADESE